MTLYIKKPIPVEAIQVREDNWDEVYDFADTFYIHEKSEYEREDSYVDFWYSEDGPAVFDELHNVWVPFEYGDWIIRGVQGELYPHKGDLFPQVYEEYKENE